MSVSRLQGLARWSLTLGLALLWFVLPHPVLAVNAGPTPQPQPIDTDRLAIPVLPEHPSAVELGRSVYYYNCMPCHGDQGQGLTEEWRQVWVEDHQNCWNRGCHGGRIDDEGFPLPHSIPALAQPPQTLARFTRPEALFAYLKETHPPQRPGVLTIEEYQAVTDFLLSENGRPYPGQVNAISPLRDGLLTLLVIVGGTGVLGLALTLQSRHRG